MTTLVTGAGGLLGGEVVRALSASGERVRALVRTQRPVDGAAEIVLGDVDDESALSVAISGCDTLMHVAGVLHGPALARASRIGEPRVVVVVSSAGVRTQQRASAAVYRAGEIAIRSVRPDAIIVRPTMIYGSDRDRNVHHVISFAARFRWLPLFGDGAARIQPIHYADLAEALSRMVRATAGSELDAAGPVPITMRHAAELIFDALDLRPRFLRLPLRVSATIAGLMGPRARERVLRFAEDRVGDPSRMIELTGIVPRPFPEGVMAEVRQMGLG